MKFFVMRRKLQKHVLAFRKCTSFEEFNESLLYLVMTLKFFYFIKFFNKSEIV